MPTLSFKPVRILPTIAAMTLVACAGQPHRPSPPVFDSNAGFSASLPGTANTEATGAWWAHIVPPPLLGQLVSTIEGSPVVALADADVEAARAQLRRAVAERGPAVDGSAALGVRRTTGQETEGNRTLGVDADVPIDISGALAAREQAAGATLDAATAAAARTRSDLARDLLLTAIDAAEARQRHRLLEQQVALTQQQLRLIELRFTQGLASGVDVLQQRDQLAALRQQLPVALLDAVVAANELRALAGLPPGESTALDLQTLPQLDPTYPEVQPRDLLRRRPALRAAQARLEAADAEFAAALADRWPEVSLSARAINTLIAGDVTNLVSATLSAALVIFDGGRNIAIAEQRRAELVAAGERLLRDWFAIVLDTDTLIHELSSLQQRLALSSDRLATAQALLQATQQRYGRGVSDYLPVLEALRGLQQQQRDDLALRAQLNRTQVRLLHGLGSKHMSGGEA
jgi:outer membrane protein TolC